jgi:MOSC domain-containing protein YiiM
VRVLEEGDVAAGDPVTVLDRPGPPGHPGEPVTVAGSMRAYYSQDAEAARWMIAVLGPASKWNASAAEWERNAGLAARG